jgi:predicted lipoprotein with Yx(FWY)xxD motif
MRMMWAAAVIAVVSAAPAASRQQTSPGANAQPERRDHPEEVAWIDEGEQGFVFRRFPGGQRLYVYDRDPRGRSVCNAGCAAAWPPVPAPADAVTVGHWSVIVRADGSRQWALKGRPVYTRFHDDPGQPIADRMDGVWRLVPYVSRERVAAGK